MIAHATIRDDMIAGLTYGGGGVVVSPELAALPQERLRYDAEAGEVIDAATRDAFYVDEYGEKHIVAGEGREMVRCEWNAPLIRFDGVWTVLTAAHQAVLRAARNEGLRGAPNDLDGWRSLASRTVDHQAGGLREIIGSPGYGQVTEYDATLADAKAFQEARAADPQADPADYPMVAAEIEALTMATGTAPDPDAVAAEIVDLSEAWYAALAAIKAVRRAAKVQIEAAASVDEIAAVLDAVEWPTVQG